MAHLPSLRSAAEAPLFSYGFRPFFLGASLFAAAAIAAWAPAYFGAISIPTAFAPRDWHMHEMLYGFTPAVVAGFLLTAVPNWTGRLPLRGRALIGLACAWAVGRVAIFASSFLPWTFAMALDLFFPALLLFVVLREIVAGENWRNLRVASLVALLLVGNATFHVEAHVSGAADYGVRVGLTAVVLLLVLIGGRIIPSFTRNWLARANPGRLPAPFGGFDALAVTAAGAALAGWVVAPDHPVTGVALLIAGLLQAVRLARWAGDRAWRDKLVFVLHAAYAFVPLGFILLACAAFGHAPASAGVHAFAAGGAGLMTLAVMSRASLGHSGRALVASRSVQMVYLVAGLAALIRILAALDTAHATPLLLAAAAAWLAAFAGFAISYWRVFTGPRHKPK